MDLQTYLSLNLSDRKLYLTPCAFARSVWSLLTHPGSRKAIEVAERFADGLGTKKEMEEALTGAPTYRSNSLENYDIAWLAVSSCRKLPARDLKEWLKSTPQCPYETILDCLGGPVQKCKRCKGQGRIFIEGQNEHPFCETCYGFGFLPDAQTLCGWELWDGDWQSIPHDSCTGCTPILSWSEGTVYRIAQDIYDRRAWDEMPVLADALQDAGCKNAIILEHCRMDGGKCSKCHGEGYIDVSNEPCSTEMMTCLRCDGRKRLPAPHSRGCWVTDLILGKR